MILYDRASSRPGPLLLIIACAFLCCILAAPAVAEQDRRDLALQLYGEGRYEEALPLFGALDAAGEADGALLYRLYFCQRHAKDPEARKTQERAREQLEKEAGDSPDLEAPFYLANVYRNVGRLTDMRRVATAATARVESGALPQPGSGVQMFRLGKLYADLGRNDETAAWYSRAIELLADDGAETVPPYAVWAARYLAEQALARDDHDAAAKYYGFLPMDGKDALPDLDNMATASCRAGRYAQAEAAWLQAERLDPANANRSRYSRHLASMAGALGRLPENGPDGRPWKELSKDELQNVMNEKVQAVRKVVASARQAEGLMLGVSASAAEALAQSRSLNKLEKQLGLVREKLLASLQAEIDEAKPPFVAAGLEFAIKRYGIRETAFFGGYAPLIFKAEQWQVERQIEATAGDAPFAEQAEELLVSLRQRLGEQAEITKLEKLLSKVEKKIGR
jgi:tetratricopeptide (TPR) repeat protein